MTNVKHPELLNIAVVTFLAKVVKKANDNARVAAGHLLDDGEGVPLRTPSGMKVGQAKRTDPERKATVTGPAALDAWIRKNYPDQVEETEEVSPDTDAVLAVLRQHAPELVVRTSRVAARMVPDVLAASEAAGEPMGPDGELDVPGVQVEKPRGVLTITFDRKTGAAAIGEMWQAGLIQLDGDGVRLALPATPTEQPEESA